MRETPFTVRNDAHWTDGAFVHVPRNMHVEDLIVLTTALGEAASSLHWRVLVVLEEGAEAPVWHETLSQDDDAEGPVNGVVELVVGQNARLRFVDHQALGERTWVFGAQRATVDRDGWLDWITLGFGSANGKVFQETQLAGPGGPRHGHRRLRRARPPAPRLRHPAGARRPRHDERPRLPRDPRRLGQRGVARHDPGRRGRPAHRTPSRSRATCCFPSARTPTRSRASRSSPTTCAAPTAAIAQIDKEQLFYLRSHGLAEPEAKRLVIEGSQALVERFEDGAVRTAGHGVRWSAASSSCSAPADEADRRRPLGLPAWRGRR